MDGCRFYAFFCFLFLLFLNPGLSRADLVNNEWYSSARALGMGNVGIASAEDPATSMFYNPAGLARIRKMEFEFLNPQLEFGTDNFQIANGLFAQSKNLSLKKIQPYLAKNIQKASYLGASLYPNFSAQNFAFGILASGQGVSYMDANNNLTYRSRYLIIPTLGISMGLLNGRMKLGVAGRAIQITENDKTVNQFTNIGYRVDAHEGFGFGVDAGMMFSLPWDFLPTFGAVARNIGDTNLPSAAFYPIATGTVQTHDKIKATYDAGFSLTPKIVRSSHFTIAVDYRDVTDAYKVDWQRKINFGAEVGLMKVLFLRAGVSRGYYTAGLGLNGMLGSLDLTTYAEELDPTKHDWIENRRFVLRFGKRF